MTVCGTPLWTAPEILRGQTYNEAADVYSFSLCLWELWAMSVPFNELGLGAMEVLLQVVNDDKRPTMPADIPPAFAELVSKCWATEPGERPVARVDAACSDAARVAGSLPRAAASA